MRGNSSLAGKILAFHEELSSTEKESFTQKGNANMKASMFYASKHIF